MNNSNMINKFILINKNEILLHSFIDIFQYTKEKKVKNKLKKYINDKEFINYIINKELMIKYNLKDFINYLIDYYDFKENNLI
jgi:hypothetical protein